MNKSKKPMTIIAIILIVIGVGIFIRQIMYRARHVQDNFLTKDQVENSVSNTTTVTQQEIASVDTAFAAAGLLYKNNDVEGLKAYIRESGAKGSTRRRYINENRLFCCFC
jgi:ABC-type microcin C transport system permease subunit YejB